MAGLRAVSDADKGDLLGGLRAQHGDIDSGVAPTVTGHTSGRPRALLPQAPEEILAIGREAVRNAMRHAGATHIDVALAYGKDGLQLRVRDDGCGIDADVLDAGARPGHWGLIGMRERAERLGASLALQCGVDGGIEVVLDVPAARAYDAAPTPAWAHMLKRHVRVGA